LKLINYLQVNTTYVFLTIVLRAGLLPCLKLTTIGMKKDTLIELEVIVVCEESGHISLNDNACTNCGKTNHTLETCTN